MLCAQTKLTAEPLQLALNLVNLDICPIMVKPNDDLGPSEFVLKPTEIVHK